MMNHTNRSGELGYDPTDLRSFPYQADDPPFGPDRLVLEEPDRAADIEAMAFFSDFLAEVLDDPTDPANYRVLDMALRLFHQLANDPAHTYEGIAYPDLFAAALDQAMTWERG